MDNLCFKRTEKESPIQQKELLRLVGLRAIVDIDVDEILDYTKVEYKFKEVDPEDFTHITRPSEG